MADIEKVKQRIKNCINSECSCNGCEYEEDGCDDHLMFDALSVIEQMEQEIERLKEHEAVKPKTGHWISEKYDDVFMCSSCEKYSRDDYPYCHWCGAKMEQEGR